MENTHKNVPRDDFKYNNKNQSQNSNFNDNNPFCKLMPVGTLFKPIQPNTRHSGRGTVCVPITSFKGVSENAGFSSKLNFFNESAKKNQKSFQKKATVDYTKDKFGNKKVINEVEKEDKKQNLKDNRQKRFSVEVDENTQKYNSLQKFQNSFNKNEKEKESKNKKKEINNNTNNSNKISVNTNINNNKDTKNNINKSNNTNNCSNNKINEKNNKNLNESKEKNTNRLDEHWKYEDILLNYNILDFTSK